jgi:hypothetical protein
MLTFEVMLLVVGVQNYLTFSMIGKRQAPYHFETDFLLYLYIVRTFSVKGNLP